MDCQQVRQEGLASKFLQGGLSEQQLGEFEAHLLACTRCANAVEALQSTPEVLMAQAQDIRKKSGGLPPPPEKTPWWKTRAWVYAVMLVFIVAGGGIGVYEWLRRPSPIVLPQSVSSPVAGAQTASAPQKEEPAGPMGPAKPVGEFVLVQFTGGGIVRPPTGGSATPQVEATAKPEIASPAHSGVSSEEDENDLRALGVVLVPTYSGPTEAAADGTQTTFQKGMTAYGQRRFTQAAELLEEAVRQDPKGSEASFFLGISLLTTGHPADSVAAFRATLQDEKSPYAQAAHFYLAKAYIQAHDLESAEGQLSVAESMPGGLKSEAASELPRVRTLRLKLAAR